MDCIEHSYPNYSEISFISCQMEGCSHTKSLSRLRRISSCFQSMPNTFNITSVDSFFELLFITYSTEPLITCVTTNHKNMWIETVICRIQKVTYIEPGLPQISLKRDRSFLPQKAFQTCHKNLILILIWVLTLDAVEGTHGLVYRVLQNSHNTNCTYMGN